MLERDIDEEEERYLGLLLPAGWILKRII